MTRIARAIAAGLLVALLAAAPAGAAGRFTIRGAGFGHGVGMSQYGAMGMASQGWGHRRILAHYYSDTGLGVLREERTVRVLLRVGRGDATFTGANAAAGLPLSPRKTYTARAHGGMVQLLGPRGKELAVVAPPLRTTGPGALVLRGPALNGRTDGAYRGALEFRPGSLGGVNPINAVSLEDYVQGVVPVESPSTWPLEALKAQAVAARTYAVTTGRGGDGWEQYPDTRSQVYGGLAVETAATNAAVAATRGQLVTYQGTPVVTFFFSTSGGRTEDVENTPLGTAPRPWLRSVEDPFDSVSPRHRWGPFRMSYKAAGRKLGSLVRGRFRGIEVRSRGRSPRVIEADVLGSRGVTRVSGATLRARFGLYDTWAYFTSIAARPAPAPAPAPADPGTGGTGPALGGAVAALRGSSRALAFPGRAAGSLAGTVHPARRGATVGVERRRGGRWVRVGAATVGRGGRFRAPVARPGTYRVTYRGDAGAAVRVGQSDTA
jgi:stage II sporulation protein D